MNIKQTVLRIIADSGDSFISGAQIADSLGVSRNAIWKAIKSLEADGFVFDAVSNKGYRISSDNNKLSSDIIKNSLKTTWLGNNIIVLDETDSTNNHAKKLASEGAENGTVILAERQSAGKGRYGRTFDSPPGTGLYMSAVLRPKLSLDATQLITSCTACAAAEALERLCGHNVDIKWVNDLYMNGRKICGILTEASLSMETKSLDYAVVGIGINVGSVKEIFIPELSCIATSVEDETNIKVSRNKLCAEILNSLETYLEDIESRSFLEEYRRRELLTGNIITASSGGSKITGTAVGIDDSANLIVRLSDGSLKTFNSGEANLCRIKKD